MWDSVKCLAEVKDDDIYLVSIVVCGEDVLEGDQQLGFAAKSTAKTILKWGEQ